MDKDEALGRIKGLLMIAADRTEEGDANGAAAAALMITDALSEGGIMPSDIEATFTATAAQGELEAEVDDFSASMEGEEEEASEDEEQEDESVRETEEDDNVEESQFATMKQKALAAIAGK